MEHKGEVCSGIQDASSTWNWPTIRERLGDQNIHGGTINVKLDNFQAFRFRCDIDFPDHSKPCGLPEALQFQLCKILIGTDEAPAYVVSKSNDYWGQRGIVEVVSRRLDTVNLGARATIIT